MWTIVGPGDPASKIKGSKNLSFIPASVTILYCSCPLHHLLWYVSTTASDYGEKPKIQKGKVLTTNEAWFCVHHHFCGNAKFCLGFGKRIPVEQTEPSSDCDWYTGPAGLLRYRREPGHTVKFATLHSGVQTANLVWIPGLAIYIYIYIRTGPLSSTGPGQSTQPTASTADKTPNLYWNCHWNVGTRWNKSFKEPAMPNSCCWWARLCPP